MRRRESWGDPYIFIRRCLSEYDIYLFSQGSTATSTRSWARINARVEGVAGVNFAVWAPNAYKVALVGDFNRWDERVHVMENNSESGIWEIFVPGLAVGARYKYEVRSHNRGYRAQKSDPYGFYSELRPQTASIVYDLGAVQMERQRLDERARAKRSALAAHEYLRAAPGFMAAQGRRRVPHLSRAGGRARALSRRHGLTPTSNCCRSPSIRWTPPGVIK